MIIGATPPANDHEVTGELRDFYFSRIPGSPVSQHSYSTTPMISGVIRPPPGSCVCYEKKNQSFHNRHEGDE
jgi:hypothetical protein